MKLMDVCRTFVVAVSLVVQLRAYGASDNFAGAQVISGSAGEVAGDNVGASKQSGEPDHAGNPGGSSVWFRWTAPAAGQFSFSTAGSTFDTLLAVYTGGNLNSLVAVTSNDDANADLSSAVTIFTASGTVYQVAIDGFDGETGAFVLSWAPEVPPVNDAFANSQVITGATGSVIGTNYGATGEPGEPNHSDDPGMRSVWFRWTAPVTGDYSFSLLATNFDATISVYTGATVNALAAVVTNDTSHELKIFSATAGTQYSVALDGYRGGMGGFVINWEPYDDGFEDPPVVTFGLFHSFTNSSGDGASPTAELILSGNTLYGTTVFGGSSGNGTVFKVNVDGTDYTRLHSFNYTSGANPYGGLILSGDILYGTTRVGGKSGWGTVFAIRTNGTGFTNLHGFSATGGPDGTNVGGALPHARLVLSGNTLYGTAPSGGSSGNGTVFAVKTDGTAFTNLRSFSATSGSPATNSDGSFPDGGLAVVGDTLFGTTVNGATAGFGAIFSIATNGTRFTNLHSFNWTDGGWPRGVILYGKTLYGVGNGGGFAGSGSLFSINTDGSAFTNLHGFARVEGDAYTNAHGASPFGHLIASGNALYGTTLGGGSSGKGTVFSVRTNGASFTTLYSFSSTSGATVTNSDGANPRSGLVISGDTLFGTTEKGGIWGHGTVFSLSWAMPELTVSRSGANVILNWPASAGGFSLQSSTNLGSAVNWSNSPASTLVDGLNTVTIPATEGQRFFRLRSP